MKQMIIYKTIGSASVIISALMMYYELQKYERMKLKQINSFILLIEYIKNQIECYLLPIDIIIRNCDTKLLNACAIDKNYKEANKLEDLIAMTTFYCDEQSVELIKQFARDFGQGYIGEQLRLCDYYRGELMKQRDKAREKGAKEQKVRLALCLCASFSLILLLI